MHNQLKDLIIVILNILIQFVLAAILGQSGQPTAIAIATLVVVFMAYYVYQSFGDFVLADGPEDDSYVKGSRPTKAEAVASWNPESDSCRRQPDNGGSPRASQEDEPAALDMARAVAYQRYASGEEPGFSSGTCEFITAGYGELNSSGYWQFPLDVAQDGSCKILPFVQKHNHF